MIKAILYDLDGVLVEARDWHKDAFNQALFETAGYQITEEDHQTTFNGLPTKEKLELLIKLGKVNLDQKQKIWDLKQEYTINFIKKASFDYDKIDLHSNCKKIGLKLACVTNSIFDTAKLMLEVTGQYKYIDLLVSNQNINNPKPCSEGYIKAMVKFGLLPTDVIIAEDSEVGLKAAKGTGANIWQVNCAADVSWSNLQKYCENKGLKL